MYQRLIYGMILSLLSMGAVILSQRPAAPAAPEEKVAAGGPSPLAPLLEDLERAREYLSRYQESANEIQATLDAQEGKYTAPGSGGDPIRNPEALPTGKNLYAINPREVPTQEAWRTGVKLIDSLLARKVGETGQYPKKIGFNLWSTETVRHHGVTTSEILYLLGVRPVWTKRNMVEGLELIPAQELGRPRIDVVVLAGGQYRDTFPSQMELIDQAVAMAAQARDSEMNFVAEGSRKVEQVLKEKGFAPKEARALAAARVFGGPPGMYGTGLTGAIARSDTWEREKKLVDLYLQREGAVYTQGIWGKFYPGLYETALNDTEVVVHSRSSNLTGGPMQLDHVFEYMGGMIMAIRQITGKDPEGVFSDVRNPNLPVMMGLQEALRVEARTRYFNPKWIQGMKEHGYSGAAEIAQMTGNLFGWQVTKPAAVDDYLWNQAFQIYVRDQYGLNLRKWFDRENPHAFQDATAIMLEAARKGYWKAPPEVLRELVNAYAQSVAQFGSSGSVRTAANQKLDQYVQKILRDAGNPVGTQLVAQYQSSLKKSLESRAADAVKGLKMEEREERQRQRKQVVTVSLVGLFLILTMSLLVWQGFRKKRSDRVMEVSFLPPKDVK